MGKVNHVAKIQTNKERLQGSGVSLPPSLCLALPQEGPLGSLKSLPTQTCWITPFGFLSPVLCSALPQ